MDIIFPQGKNICSMTGDSVLFVLWYFMLCNICDGLKVAQGLSFQAATTNPYPLFIKDGFPVKGDPMVLLAAMQYNLKNIKKHSAFLILA